MSSLRAIRKRITSVKNTQQITKAMKMVSAAKLRRAQEAITSARPYALMMKESVFDLARRVGSGDHPLLKSREVNKRGVLIITSDRGLCGGFNSSLMRSLNHYMEEEEGKLEALHLYTVGRKARDFYRRRHTLKKDYINVLANVTYSVAEKLAKEMTDEFINGEIDELLVYFNEFRSAISQISRVEKLLPIEVEREDEEDMPVEFIYEPEKAIILDTLLPRYVTTQMYRFLLESVAGEHGARMTAMDAATNNAVEMIDRLTLQMNRARQATITRELMEIIGGKEAIENI